MSEIVLLITETDKQSSGFQGAGRGGVLLSTEPRCNSVQEVLTGSTRCEETGQVYQGLWLVSQRPHSYHHMVEDEFDAGQLKYTFSAEKPKD